MMMMIGVVVADIVGAVGDSTPGGDQSKRGVIIEISPLPPRYHNMVLPQEWFAKDTNKNARRKHRKSHGAATFK